VPIVAVTESPFERRTMASCIRGPTDTRHWDLAISSSPQNPNQICMPTTRACGLCAAFEPEVLRSEGLRIELRPVPPCVRATGRR